MEIGFAHVLRKKIFLMNPIPESKSNNRSCVQHEIILKSFYMEKKILNYRIIIEKEKVDVKKQYVYNAYCPSLGVADYGKTIDEAIQRVTNLIKFHLDSLVETGYKVPVEREATTVITTVEVSTSPQTKFSYV